MAPEAGKKVIRESLKHLESPVFLAEEIEEISKGFMVTL